MNELIRTGSLGRFLMLTIGLIVSSPGMTEPVVDAIEDQQFTEGPVYSFQPRLLSQAKVLWRKSYGPDDLTVDPFTGQVDWKIPVGYAKQSLHVGVIASDGSGEYEEVWVLTIGTGAVTYVDSDDRLDRAIRRMKSGDTLIMRPGEIDSSVSSNRIDGKKSAQPPSGKPGSMTTVIAEEPGRTVMDVHDADVFGLHLIGSRYVKISGLVIKNAGRIGVRLIETDHVYLSNIGVAGSGRSSNSYNHNVANLNVILSSNFIIEGLYSWGHSRYKAQFTRSKQGVVRRSVARIDHYYGSNPIGGYQSYCSRDIVYQNNMLIDSDTSKFWPRFKNHQNAFGVPATGCPALPVGNVFDRSIVLNSHIGPMQTDASDAEGPTVWRDMLGWDILLDGYKAGRGPPTSLMRGVGLSETIYATLGEVSFRESDKFPGARYLYSRNAPSTVSHSIIVNIKSPGDLLWSNDPKLTLSDSIVYNHRGRLTTTENAFVERIQTDDPELRYLVRPPAALSHSCAGSRCGAQIMTFVGKAGTFWGETDYDAETGVPAWPAPGQAIIAEHMRAYRHEGRVRGDGVEKLSGDRGFSKVGTNLTDYVWGYLGEPLPPLLVFARSLADGAEVAWLPTSDDGVASYNVYALEDGDFRKIASVPHADSVLRSIVPIGDASGPFRVTAVMDDGRESGPGYDVLPR